MPVSKRKERAQEVEIVSVFNKRLRKSFLASRKVWKSPPRLHNVSQNKLSQGSSRSPFHDFLPPEAPQHEDLSFSFNESSDPESIPDVAAHWHPKKRKGQVRAVNINHPDISTLAIYRLKINLLKIGYL